jgi:hypothetical protein
MPPAETSCSCSASERGTGASHRGDLWHRLSTEPDSERLLEGAHRHARLCLRRIQGFRPRRPDRCAGAALKKGLEGWYVIPHDTSTVGAVELDRDYQARVRSLITSTAQKAPEIIVSRYIFEAEVMSDAYLPIWLMASGQYWVSYNAFQGLEAKKAELLAGYDPTTMTRVTLDKNFRSGSGLTVSLTVARPPGATLPLSLVVRSPGDRPARRGRARVAPTPFPRRASCRPKRDSASPSRRASV